MSPDWEDQEESIIDLSSEGAVALPVLLASKFRKLANDERERK
jgi:hypothetical protein